MHKNTGDVKALKNWGRRERWWESGIHVRRCCEGPWLVPSSPARAAAAVAPPLLPTRLRQPAPSRHPKPRLLRSSVLALVRPFDDTRGGGKRARSFSVQLMINQEDQMQRKTMKVIRD
jgi:hypothetical protein